MRCLMEQVVLQRSSLKKEREFSGELKLIDEPNAFNEGECCKFRDICKYIIYGFYNFHAIFFLCFSDDASDICALFYRYVMGAE